jgi:hypothetical protein
LLLELPAGPDAPLLALALEDQRIDQAVEALLRQARPDLLALARQLLGVEAPALGDLRTAGVAWIWPSV